MGDRILELMRKRLEKWELEHLRELAIQLQDRLERAEADAIQERTFGDHWHREAMSMISELSAEGRTIGLTKSAEILVSAPPTSSLEVPILNEGEIYLGAIICGESAHRHHTILLPGDVENKTWKQAMKWAADQGGELPNRVEQALLFAALKSEFQESAYWSNSQHAVFSDFAWCQNFGSGSQYNYNTYDKLRARAVRRLIIQ